MAVQLTPEIDRLAIESRLGVARRRQRPLELIEVSLGLRALCVELDRFGPEGLQVAAHALFLAFHGLDVLLTGKARGLVLATTRLKSIVASGEPAELHLYRSELGRRVLDVPPKAVELLLQLTEGPFPPQDGLVIALALAVAPATGQASGRPQHFTGWRDVGRDHTVPAPQVLGLIEMRDQAHASEKVAHQLRSASPDQARRPAHILGLFRQVQRGRQGLERQ